MTRNLIAAAALAALTIAAPSAFAQAKAQVYVSGLQFDITDAGNNLVQHGSIAPVGLYAATFDNVTYAFGSTTGTAESAGGLLKTTPVSYSLAGGSAGAGVIVNGDTTGTQGEAEYDANTLGLDLLAGYSITVYSAIGLFTSVTGIDQTAYAEAGLAIYDNVAETFLQWLTVTEQGSRFSAISFTNSTGSDMVVSAGGYAYAEITSAVPEPGNMALLLAGVGALGFVARRRKA